MRYNGDVSEITISQSELAKLLGISQPRISQLIDEKVVIKDEGDPRGSVYLFDSAKNYFLSNKTSSDGVNYWQEKARNEKVKRELNELKLQERQGELYDAADVESAIAETIVTLRTNLLALPAKFSSQLEGKSKAEIYQLLNAEIEDKLQEISQLDVEKLKSE